MADADGAGSRHPDACRESLFHCQRISLNPGLARQPSALNDNMDPTRPKRGHERRVAEVRKSSTRSIHVHRPSFGSGSMFLQCSAPNTCIILKNFVPRSATENRVHVSVPSWLKVSSAPLESFFGAARPGTETVPPNPSGAFAPLIQMSDTQTQKLETVEALLQPHDTLLIFFWY